MDKKPMKLQTADPAKISCRDCLYRDKTVVKVDGETLRVGITRDTCLVFDGKRGNWKPSDVYFQNADCMFYEKDENAERFWEKKG